MQKPIILLVEDNPDDEALTMRAIRKNKIDCEVVTAHDGEEAINYLLGDARKHGQKPAFVLLDLKLPKLNGLQVLEKIRSDIFIRHLPVIIMTSSNEESDLTQSYRLGANSFVAKPVDFSDLVESIRLLARYWLETNVSPSS